MGGEDSHPPARGGIGRAAALAGVYLLGLLSWGVWVGAIIYLIVRFLSA